MGDTGDRTGHHLQAELEEMRVERFAHHFILRKRICKNTCHRSRDLARADLESAQLMVYNLRSEIEEMENQNREDQVVVFASLILVISLCVRVSGAMFLERPSRFFVLFLILLAFNTFCSIKLKQSEQRKQYLEEKQSWHATVALLNEKVDCARCFISSTFSSRLYEFQFRSRIESEFVKQEMKRQSEDFAKKLELQEAELRKNVEDQRAR